MPPKISPGARAKNLNTIKICFLKHPSCPISGNAKNATPAGDSLYKARGVLYAPEKARFSYLISLAENENLGKSKFYGKTFGDAEFL
jgi:hypothetical protein